MPIRSWSGSSAFAEGDHDAFEKLYAAYQMRLFSYLLRMVGDAGAAEELTNDTMVSAWKAAGNFKGHSKASTCLFAIARNKALTSDRIFAEIVCLYKFAAPSFP